jgi:hypothetical protein
MTKIHITDPDDPTQCLCGVPFTTKARAYGDSHQIISAACCDRIREIAAQGLTFGQIRAYTGFSLWLIRYALHAR